MTACGGDEEESAGSTSAVPPPTVVVAEILSQTIPVEREFVARTEAESTVEFRARVEVFLESIEFEEGIPVSKGQVLYRLDPRTYTANLKTAQAQLERAKANLKLAEEQVSVRAAEAAVSEAKASLVKFQQDVARYQPLVEKDAVPREDLDTALAQVEVGQAMLEARQADLENAQFQEVSLIELSQAKVMAAEAAVDLAQLDLDYCTISSPIDGLIGRTDVDAGNLVGRGEATVLATVSTIDPMLATFAITEEQYLWLREHMQETGIDRERQQEVEGAALSS